MSNVLILLTVLAVVKSVLSLSLSRKWWYVLAVGVLCGIWVILEHSPILSWSKQKVDSRISEYTTLMNLSLVIMCDLLLTVGQCWVVMQQWFGKAVKPREGWMLYNPCLSLFPALTYLHVCLFFALPGVDFLGETLGLALGVLCFLCGGSYILRKLIPELDLRLELTGILAFLLFLAVVSCAIFHPSVQVRPAPQVVVWKQVYEVAGVLCLFVCIGFLIRYFKCFKKKKYRF